MVGIGCGNGGGLGAGTSSPQGPAGRGGIANPLDASGGSGQRGLALSTSWAWAHGGGRCRAGAWGWCRGGGGREQQGDRLFAGPQWPILSGMTVGWPIVCGGLVSCWQACGVGWTAPLCKTDRLTCEVGLCLDLSCLAPGPKEPLGLGLLAYPAIENHLWLTFEPT